MLVLRLCIASDVIFLGFGGLLLSLTFIVLQLSVHPRQKRSLLGADAHRFGSMQSGLALRSFSISAGDGTLDFNFLSR